jgi:hypothetical protein
MNKGCDNKSNNIIKLIIDNDLEIDIGNNDDISKQRFHSNVRPNTTLFNHINDTKATDNNDTNEIQDPIIPSSNQIDNKVHIFI